jgi:hypothetical protein
MDRKPLRSRRPAERSANYLGRYLVTWPDGAFEVTETVRSAGRALLSYTSRMLTRRMGCSMRALRNVRVVWAWRGGLVLGHGLSWVELLVALCLLKQAAAGRSP